MCKNKNFRVKLLGHTFKSLFQEHHVEQACVPADILVAHSRKNTGVTNNINDGSALFKAHSTCTEVFLKMGFFLLHSQKTPIDTGSFK